MASSAFSRISNIQKHFNPSNPTSKGEKIIKISSEVSEALSGGKAVVVLESSIMSHGLCLEELERLAVLGGKARKTARRGIAHVVSKDRSYGAGKTPVAVVYAGVKSIFDIPRTLEYLETQRVCVAGYKTDEFLVFFSEKSACKKKRNRVLEACGGIFLILPHLERTKEQK